VERPTPRRPSGPVAGGEIRVGDVDVRAAAQRWARDRYTPTDRVRDLAPMPGNSGLSFGFTVTDADDTRLDAIVLRLAPPGVRRAGNTDVLRQVPLLRALHEAAIPVAPLRWSTDDPAWFGTDAIAQAKVDARPLHLYDIASGVDPGPDHGAGHLRRAVEALAAVHALDWRRALPDWERPRDVPAELGRWLPLLARAGDPAVTAAGEATYRLLCATAPTDPPIGLFHGDFQTNNVLYDPADGSVVAVVDWEIAGIGPQLLDLGWLAVMTDAGAWGPEHRARMKVLTEPWRLPAWYEQASGHPVERFAWYQAMAAFRFAAIAAFNLHLHRTCRRHDPLYEGLTSSVPALFAHATRLATA